MLNCPTCVYADFENDKCKRLLNRLPHICPYAEERKPRNNFERLKGLSMEEMAVWFATVPMSYEGTCPNPRPVDCLGWDEERCTNCWLSWLKEEVEE